MASVALRSIHHAGECISLRPEQEEVLTILNKIHKETGWRVKFIEDDLIKNWGWNDQKNFEQMPNIMGQAPNMVQNYASQYAQQNQGMATPLPPAPPVKPAMKSGMVGIVNPMLAKADFSQPIHPYQSYYVAPNHPAQPAQFNHF